MYSKEDVLHTLHETVCLYKGLPVIVFVSNDLKDDQIMIQYTNGKSEVINYTESEFNYSAPEIGYVNYRNSAYYLSRSPIRGRKQGLDVSNLITDPDLPPGEKRNLLKSKSLSSCITNKYPNFSVILIDIREGLIKSLAFSRLFALGRVDYRLIGVFFRGRLVGNVIKNTNKVKIHQISGRDIIVKLFLEQRGSINE